MKKLLTVLPLFFLFPSSTYAQDALMCGLGGEYVNPARYVTVAEVDQALKHPPQEEADYLWFGLYFEAKKAGVPDTTLEELAWNITAFYKGLKNPRIEGTTNVAAEPFGGQLVAIFDELHDKKYIKVYQDGTII